MTTTQSAPAGTDALSAFDVECSAAFDLLVNLRRVAQNGTITPEARAAGRAAYDAALGRHATGRPGCNCRAKVTGYFFGGP